jgi:D-serine dehydratase
MPNGLGGKPGYVAFGEKLAGRFIQSEMAIPAQPEETNIDSAQLIDLL